MKYQITIDCESYRPLIELSEDIELLFKHQTYHTLKINRIQVSHID